MSATAPTDYRLHHLRQVLGDRYEFEAFLGRGAFATVYLARNLHLGRREAVKVMSEVHDGDRDFTSRFVEEAKLVASLDHPNIVKVYDFGEADGMTWYAMQYIDGPTLRAELEERTRLDPEAVARLAIPLLDALQLSHSQGIVHRDIKPSNIILDQRGRPYVMDFGIAKSAESALRTMTGNILGTPVYISPEQMSGHTVDGRADIYSLGIAMYEMVSGRPPFFGQDSLKVMLRRLSEDPEPLTGSSPDVDPRLESIILRALAREVGGRFQDADEMRLALIELVGSDWNEQRYTLKAEAPEQKKLAAPPLRPTEVREDSRGATVESGSVVADAPPAAATASAAPAPPTASGRSRGRVWGLVATALVVLGLGAFGWFRMVSPKAGDNTASTGGLQEGLRAAPEPASVDLSPESGSETVPPVPAASSSEGSHASEEKGADEEPTSAEAAATTPGEVPKTVVAKPSVPPAASPPLARERPTASLPPPEPIRRPVVGPRLLEQATAVVLAAEEAARCKNTSAIVSVRIGEEGQVLSAKVIQSDLPDCRDAAKTLAERSRFVPAKDIEDRPVVSKTTLSFQFDEVDG